MDAVGVPTASWAHSALRWLPRDGAGLCGAALLWLSGLAPSLLPRPTVVAVALAGLLGALGYGIGCLVGWVARSLARAPRMTSRWLYLAAAVLWAIALAMTVIAAEWQREQLASLGMTTPAPAWWIVLAGGLLLAWALVALGRGLRALSRKVSAHLLPRTGRVWASTVGVLSAVVAIAAVAVAAYGATWFMFDRIDRAGSGQAAPTSALRSGGPGSLVPFASLGAEGQSFVTGGPSMDTIAQQSTRQVVEPVRVYVGLASAPDAQSRAKLAVQELQRTGAFQRPLVVVATSTGNGFLDPDLVDTPELLEDGDVATVSMQYSVLPSWLSFLVDQGAAEEAATALFTEVKAAIDELPASERPKLAVSGESLGAFGSQAPFAGMDPAQVAEQVDYAVWVGTPGATELWSTWRDDRTAGPEWQPAIEDGTIARNPATADSPVWSEPGWGPRRIVLTQHANDPVSWWSPSLLLSRPGWLSEPRGPGVDARMTWWPVVLFLQTGLDLAAAGSVPPGVGHDYGDVTAQAWRYALDMRASVSADVTHKG